MTSTIAIVIALSLMINGINLVYKSKIITDEHPESKLTFLLSTCLLLKKIHFIPCVIWKSFLPGYLILEIPLSLIFLESALLYVWTPFKDCLLLHSDDILVHLYENMSLEWLICPLCCDKNDCSYAFATLVVKVMSFMLLLSICFVTKK
ncbi:uncharacterized protein LOC124540222 [Vanessa cardui]|uniref:uncharacterized protein LOC124540222 n=1 Tax=Vanessa cardui TaxID=171605 RepID=UPI001F12A0B5|nr:uncharacterized protein LOC124540222 [Vanessa cardui]